MIVLLRTAKEILKALRWAIFISLFYIQFFAFWNSARAQTFTAGTNYAAGTQPVSIAAADVNSDGQVDLIIASVSSSGLRVLTNSGSGNFGVPESYPVPQPQDVIAVDVNGDGKVDLACNSLSGLIILTNIGDGHFQLANNYGFAGSYSVRAADLNGDNKVDLVTGNGSVLTNTGNGTFVLASSSGISALSIALADLNGDGAPDLIEATGSSLIILTNAGKGVFHALVTNTLPMTWPGTICAADVNHDRYMDIVVPVYDSTQGTNIIVLTNNGEGILGLNAAYTVSKGPWCVTAADVNGDGWIDLISSENFSHATILTNDASGHFVVAASLIVGVEARSVIAADFDGDGRLDVVTANQAANNISLLFNRMIFPPPTLRPALTIGQSLGNVAISWPSDSPGWSLQQSSGLNNWGPAGYEGYPITDDETNRSLTVVPIFGVRRFRLTHP
jgi:hypothetical protein